jgi:hypothetical protein
MYEFFHDKQLMLIELMNDEYHHPTKKLSFRNPMFIELTYQFNRKKKQGLLRGCLKLRNIESLVFKSVSKALDNFQECGGGQNLADSQTQTVWQKIAGKNCLLEFGRQLLRKYLKFSQTPRKKCREQAPGSPPPPHIVSPECESSYPEFGID